MANMTLMMDANARYAICKKINELGLSPKDFLKKKEGILEEYKDDIKKTYADNARWSISFGEELFKSNKGTDYVVLVYNEENKSRAMWDQIQDKAIAEVGQEVIDRLGKHANVYAIGSDKAAWKKRFPQLKTKMGKPAEGENRAIFVFGLQHGKSYDREIENVRDMDYFIRAGQLRLSGMYFNALDNSRFILLTHPTLLYDPRRLMDEIMISYREDRKHDKFNLYSDPSVYEGWGEAIKTPPEAIISSVARSPKIVSF